MQRERGRGRRAQPWPGMPFNARTHERVRSGLAIAVHKHPAVHAHLWAGPLWLSAQVMRNGSRNRQRCGQVLARGLGPALVPCCCEDLLLLAGFQLPKQRNIMMPALAPVQRPFVLATRYCRHTMGAG